MGQTHYGPTPSQATTNRQQGNRQTGAMTAHEAQADTTPKEEPGISVHIWQLSEHNPSEPGDHPKPEEDSEEETIRVKSELQTLEKHRCQHDPCGAHFRTVCADWVADGAWIPANVFLGRGIGPAPGPGPPKRTSHRAFGMLVAQMRKRVSLVFEITVAVVMSSGLGADMGIAMFRRIISSSIVNSNADIATTRTTTGCPSPSSQYRL